MRISVGREESEERMVTSRAIAAAVFGWSPVTMLREGEREGGEGRGKSRVTFLHVPSVDLSHLNVSIS
jgi:hypothetical protein